MLSKVETKYVLESSATTPIEGEKERLEWNNNKDKYSRQSFILDQESQLRRSKR